MDLTLCQSVLRIDDVDAVQYRGLDGDLDGVKFELLTIMAEPRDAGDHRMTLLFAGDVRAQASGKRDQSHACRISVKTWPADVAPHHDLATTSSQDN